MAQHRHRSNGNAELGSPLARVLPDAPEHHFFPPLEVRVFSEPDAGARVVAAAGSRYPRLQSPAERPSGADLGAHREARRRAVAEEGDGRGDAADREARARPDDDLQLDLVATERSGC